MLLYSCPVGSMLLYSCPVGSMLLVGLELNQLCQRLDSDMATPDGVECVYSAFRLINLAMAPTVAAVGNNCSSAFTRYAYHFPQKLLFF